MQEPSWSRRLALGLLAALVLSLLYSITIGASAGVTTSLDRAFIVLVPTAALGAILAHVGPPIVTAFRNRRPGLLAALMLLALAAGFGTAHRPDQPAAFWAEGVLTALIFFVLMLTAAGAWERRIAAGGLGVQLAGSVLAVGTAWLVVALLKVGLEKAAIRWLVASAAALTAAVVITLALQCTRRSLHLGFLARPLHRVLVFIPPAAAIAVVLLAGQFPETALWDELSFPSRWLGSLVSAAVLGCVFAAPVTEWLQAEARRSWLEARQWWVFLRRELPGLYAAIGFFLIYLSAALALNHPALNVNTVLFESDAGQWLQILASPEAGAVNRAVHPLVLILIRPLVRLVAIPLGPAWPLAGPLMVALMSAAVVFMTWLFVKRLSRGDTYAFLFALLLGSTATQLLFGSLVETFAFATAALLVVWLLIQQAERREPALAAAGVAAAGITLSNIAQPILGYFFRTSGLSRTVRLTAVMLAALVCLTIVAAVAYPGSITLFFVPSDAAFETQFLGQGGQAGGMGVSGRALYVARAMFLYGLLGPEPVEVVAHKPPQATLDLKTYDARSGRLASYRGLANVPLAAWLVVLLGGIGLAGGRIREVMQGGLLAGLAAVLGFNFLLHMVYGTELFLYTPYWTFALVLLLALAYQPLAERSWFAHALMAVLIAVLTNNLVFLRAIFVAVAPFFGAAG